jgi:hypothetical protein
MYLLLYYVLPDYDSLYFYFEALHCDCGQVYNTGFSKWIELVNNVKNSVEEIYNVSITQTSVDYCC